MLVSASARTTLVGATAMSVLAAFRGPLAARGHIREIHLFAITAATTSGAVGLCRSTALGTGVLTSVVGIPYDPNDPTPVGQIITNWGTALPTVGIVATVFRRWDQTAAIGNGVIWTFYQESGLIVPINSAAAGDLCLVNLQATAPGTFDITVVWEE